MTVLSWRLDLPPTYSAVLPRLYHNVKMQYFWSSVISLSAVFKSVFPDQMPNNQSAKYKDKTCSDYHHLISSQEFKDSWTAFLKKMGTNSHPSLYQFVTTKLMDSLIMKQLPIPGVSFSTPSLAPELTTVEENALWYVAGYVVKHTRDKIRSSRHTMQETLLHGLDQLCSTHHPHNYCEVESEQWINSVDRGGLVHVI